MIKEAVIILLPSFLRIPDSLSKRWICLIFMLYLQLRHHLYLRQISFFQYPHPSS